MVLLPISKLCKATLLLLNNCGCKAFRANETRDSEYIYMSHTSDWKTQFGCLFGS